MKPRLWVLFVFCFALLITACSTFEHQLALQPSATAVEILPSTVSLTPTPTATKTKFVFPTRTPTITNTPTITDTPTITALPIKTQVNIAQIGTSLPQSDQTIALDNLTDLAQVGQWGYGMINGAAFTPDGSRFIVSSAFGFAIYDMNNLESPPEWVPFEQPITHDWIYFDESGRYIKLVNWNWHIDTMYTIITFPEGKTAKDTNNLIWIQDVAEPNDNYMEDISSADGTKIFRPGYSIGETQFDRHTAKCYILDATTDKTLFALQDETTVISYAERVQSNGCDANLRQACGTSNVPVSYFPFQAAFAPDNSTITVRYQKWAFYEFEMTNNGFIRIYDGTDGSLLELFGNPSDQTAAFAYSPDSKYLLVTYKDGSLQLWNTHSGEISYSGWQFNDRIQTIEISNHGENVLIERPEYLEIRSSTNGALRSRLKALQFDLSPADDNIIAYTDTDHNIKIYDINEADILLTIPAHKDEIFDIEFSPDGKTIASSSRDCTIKLWDVTTGAFLHYFEETIVDANDPFPHANMGDDRLSRIFIYHLKFIEETNSLFGFSPWSIAVNWNTDSGATQYAIYETPDYWENFTVLKNFNVIFFGNRKYDFETGEELFRGDYSSIQESIAAFNNGSNKFKIKEYQDYYTLPYYDIDDNLLGTIDVIKPGSSDVNLDQVFISPDGTNLYISISNGCLMIYQIVE